MIHKNIDKCLELLPGSFSQNDLLWSYTCLCFENQVETPSAAAPLISLINGWVSFFSTLKKEKKVFLGELVLQDSTTTE